MKFGVQSIHRQPAQKYCCRFYNSHAGLRSVFVPLARSPSTLVWLQDPVPLLAKFGAVYVRPGHRVLITPRGDMMVRPTPLDHKLNPTGKIVTLRVRL